MVRNVSCTPLSTLAGFQFFIKGMEAVCDTAKAQHQCWNAPGAASVLTTAKGNGLMQKLWADVTGRPPRHSHRQRLTTGWHRRDPRQRTHPWHLAHPCFLSAFRRHARLHGLPLRTQRPHPGHYPTLALSEGNRLDGYAAQSLSNLCTRCSQKALTINHRNASVLQRIGSVALNIQVAFCLGVEPILRLRWIYTD